MVYIDIWIWIIVFGFIQISEHLPEEKMIYLWMGVCISGVGLGLGIVTLFMMAVCWTLLTVFGR